MRRRARFCDDLQHPVAGFGTDVGLHLVEGEGKRRARDARLSGGILAGDPFFPSHGVKMSY